MLHSISELGSNECKCGGGSSHKSLGSGDLHGEASSLVAGSPDVAGSNGGGLDLSGLEESNGLGLIVLISGLGGLSELLSSISGIIKLDGGGASIIRVPSNGVSVAVAGGGGVDLIGGNELLLGHVGSEGRSWDSSASLGGLSGPCIGDGLGGGVLSSISEFLTLGAFIIREGGKLEIFADLGISGSNSSDKGNGGELHFSQKFKYKIILVEDLKTTKIDILYLRCICLLTYLTAK